MTTAAIKQELNTYIPLLSARQQTLVLDMIKNILHVDWKEQRISIEQYNAEINSALKEVKSGKSISHKEVAAQSKKWLKRK